MITALIKIQARLDKGEEVRDDDFFRMKIGHSISASTIIEGVLTKARTQYEERKVLLLGDLLESATFDSSLSANDLSWMLACIDSLTYQHLLILGFFYNNQTANWDTNNVQEIHTRDAMVSTQIEELRSRGLLTGHTTFTVPLQITSTGRLLARCTGLTEEFKWHGSYIESSIGSPVTTSE